MSQPTTLADASWDSSAANTTDQHTHQTDCGECAARRLPGGTPRFFSAVSMLNCYPHGSDLVGTPTDAELEPEGDAQALVEIHSQTGAARLGAGTQTTAELHTKRDASQKPGARTVVAVQGSVWIAASPALPRPHLLSTHNPND